MRPGFLKRFVYGIPVILFASVVFLSIYKNGHEAKVLSCESCHSGMEHKTFLMSVPPDVGKYYKAAKSDKVDELAVQVLNPKDAHWQVMHLYNPNTFSIGWEPM